MIEKLEIKNFQSHKDSVLQFTPGVNVIIGKTDSGKSAVIRALRLLIENKPGGEAYRSEWGGTTDVEITTSEGNKVARGRDNTGNYYKLNGDLYRAFNREIPDELENAINIGAINTQYQFDPPYLLGESSGYIAKHFNDLANLEKIDQMLFAINKKIRTHKQAHKVEKQELKTLKESLAELPNLPKLEMEINTLRTKQAEAQLIIQSKSKLQSNIKKVESINGQLKQLNVPDGKEEAIDYILQLYKERKEVEQQKEVLEIQVNKLERLNRRLEQLNKKVKAEFVLNIIFDLKQKAGDLRQSISKLNKDIANVQKTKERLDKAQENLTNLQTTFEENMPDVCPLCGTELK